MKQEAKAQLRYARMSPRKTRLLLDMVRGMRAVDAVAQLRFSNKSIAAPLRKLILSVIANAKSAYALDENSLVISKAYADAGPTQNRWTPRAFGRASPIRKRTAHVTIVVEGEAGEQKMAKALEVEEKKIPVKKKIVKRKETK